MVAKMYKDKTKQKILLREAPRTWELQGAGVAAVQRSDGWASLPPRNTNTQAFNLTELGCEHDGCFHLTGTDSRTTRSVK